MAGEIPIVDVNSLTHYGEPYDGNTRFFRSTLFVAAVRASYGEACLIHGAEFMPPKVISSIVNIQFNSLEIEGFKKQILDMLTILSFILTFQMGVTEEQMLNHMGALTRLHPIAAAKLLEV